MRVIVIGAGIGGLSAACIMANKGHQVQLIEQNKQPGGKMNLMSEKGYRFDTGPSLLTMPFILKQLFQQCGEEVEEHLKLIEPDPLCKYFYPDGTVFNSYINREQALKEINRIAPEDAEAYIKFLDYAESLYNKTADAFIFNPLYSLKDFGNLNLWDFFGIDAFATVSNKVDQYFSSSYLRKFFKRFTTYNGSSPYLAPATLNVIPHVEINQGGYYVKGGLYKITECLHELAKRSGVEFKFNSKVDKIRIDNDEVEGVIVNGTPLDADLVIANSDFSETVRHMLPPDSISRKQHRKAEAAEPSSSGFVLLLGVDTRYQQLNHHNIFFSGNYEEEFRQIFQEKVMPDDPTIYVANTSHTDKGHAPQGHSNLFILVNAPYLIEHHHWDQQKHQYGDKVIEELEKRGLDDLSNHIIFRDSISPKDFYHKYRSNKGSIYGTSSNSTFSAFVRPRNKSREIKGLYFVGGSTHPGGGIPLVIQSAFNAASLIERYE
ncbi:MAG: phytoene desaturase [Balneolaceae bacterium]|nr:phytoene desaturase [Balneolaceae bacterium]